MGMPVRIWGVTTNIEIYDGITKPLDENRDPYVGHDCYFRRSYSAFRLIEWTN